ncbi:MAG: mechanosensitive ion channel domain-containing protein [Candidatus Scalinduaceae bacterium]
MNVRKLVSIIIILVSISFGLTTDDLCSQPTEIKDLTLKRTELLENIKKTLVNHRQDITNLESSVRGIKEELRTLNATREKLIEDKVESAVLESVAKQKGVIEDRINTLNENVRVRTEMTKVASALRKALEVTSTLTDKKNKISDEAALLPVSQFESIQKEAELLKASLEAILVSVKEKETYLSTSKTSLEVTKLKLEDEKKKLKDKIKALTSQKPSTPEGPYRIENMKRSLENEIKLQDDKINLLLAQTELARLNLHSVQTKKLNTQLEIDIKTGIASILSQKFKEEEVQRKEKEAEEARRVEEERKRIAEEEKAKAELEKKKALKKEEIAVQKQLEETSPEKRRVLEIEADVHKQQVLIATIKDDLITTGTVRQKDRAEFIKTQKNIEKLLGGENTPGEIAEELEIVKVESKNIQDKINTIQSLLTAAEKQKSIIVESLKNSRADLLPTILGEKSRIEAEAADFSDKALGERLIKLANLRVKHIEEQNSLIETKVERLNERLEINNVLLEKLIETQKTLSQIRAANVWARRESKISTKTAIEAFSDLKVFKTIPIDLYRNSSQSLKKLSIFLSNSKNIPTFTVKLCIIIAIILLAYLARRYLNGLARQGIQRFAATSPQTFYTFKLIPGLLRIMQNTLAMFFLFVISLTISLTLPSNAPVILSTIYGFAILSVYKLLKSFVVEILSPYTGMRRWVPITYSSARHIFKGLNLILLFSAITITLICVLNTYEYKKDVIELLWFIYRIVTLFLIVWITARERSVLLNLLPYSESALGKFVNKIINLLYPILIAFIILLFAIRSLGYVLLTYTLIATLIKSMVIAVIAYLVYRYLLGRLLNSQEHRLSQRKPIEIEEFESEKRAINFRFRVYKNLLDYGILIITVIVILGIWNDTFKDVVSSPAAPKLFRDIYEEILYVLASIKNGLTYKFVLAEGRYTTPFKMLFGVLVLIVAFICARYLRNILQTRVYEKAQLEKGARHAISSGITYFIIGIAAIIGLNIAGIPLRSLAIFAGAFGIGLGFGMQNIISNLVSGIIIFFEKPIRIGDVITLDKDIAGKVEKISIRSTVVSTFDRKTVVVPNSKFLESNVVNWMHGGDMLLRSKIEVGVAYGSNTELVRECLLKVMDSHPDVEKEPEPVVRFAEFGNSSLNFEIYFWAHIFKRWMAISDLNFAIDKIFRENNIEIPFPQRDLHIRSEKSIDAKVETFIDKDSDVDLENPKIDE